MSTTFKEELSKVPDYVKIQLDISFAIADRIGLALKEQQLTKKDLAKRMGVSQGIVSSWLSGTHNFTVRTIARISAVLGIRLV